MPDMESLDRAVEEARRKIAADMDGATVLALGSAGMRRLSVNVDALIEAVDARARAEERERLVTAMVMAGRLVDEASLVLETALLPTDEPARSSEEARNG